MRLIDYKEELREEKRLAAEISEALFTKRKFIGLNVIEWEMEKLISMVIQTHQSILDYMEELSQPQGIDKDRLIDELEEGYEQEVGKLKMISVDKAVQIINQQPTSDGWIPCSSGQMPPIDKEVWITYTYPNGFCDCSFAHLGKDGEWYSKNFGLRLSSDRITAWQPLPLPYKEGEEE